MDKETLSAATAAEKAVRKHDSSCTAGCKTMGLHYREDRLRRAKRCASGEAIWDAWFSFRPTPLPGKGRWRGPDEHAEKNYALEKLHEIGPYMIAELRRDTSDEKGVRAWAKHGKTVYLAFVDGASTNQYWEDVSLEYVLLFALDWRINGEGSAAYHYAGRVLRMPGTAED